MAQVFQPLLPQQRAEIVEYRIAKIEKAADKYLADIAEYKANRR